MSKQVPFSKVEIAKMKYPKFLGFPIIITPNPQKFRFKDPKSKSSKGLFIKVNEAGARKINEKNQKRTTWNYIDCIKPDTIVIIE